ncbi:hypothetical protein [Maridesulfovibrio sp.]|uniref:hypothetical protein n=1 Tax=Maridesulfovibrio sp. TaxID=2795000 RepID=UPI002A18C3B7|nr:hypothetical protein [Maridesulfovibrio sp.]
MLPLILAGMTLLAIIGISIYARRKGQSGFGVFFLLYSVISIIVHFVTADAATRYDFMKILPQIGVIISSGGAIFAQSKGKNKIVYALPGLFILGAAIMLNIPPHGPETDIAVQTANQTIAK